MDADPRRTLRFRSKRVAHEHEEEEQANRITDAKYQQLSDRLAKSGVGDSRDQYSGHSPTPLRILSSPAIGGVGDRCQLYQHAVWDGVVHRTKHAKLLTLDVTAKLRPSHLRRYVGR
jgi:hypothetical protein